jgi:hypothetical protein
MYTYNFTSSIKLKNAEDWFIYDVHQNKLRYVNPKSSAVQKALKEYIPDISPFLKNADKKNISEEELIELCKRANKTMGV